MAGVCSGVSVIFQIPSKLEKKVYAYACSLNRVIEFYSCPAQFYAAINFIQFYDISLSEIDILMEYLNG